MSTVQEIIQKGWNGEISIGECWTQLRQLARLRASKRAEIVLVEVPSKNYEPINEYEIKAIGWLQSVNFGMSRGAWRFVKQIQGYQELTARQREFLRALVFTYRRQLWRHNSDGHARAFQALMKGEK